MPRARVGGGMSITELQSLLARGRAELNSLRRERGKLQGRLDALDRRINQLGGGRVRGGGGRGRNQKSLVTCMEEVLKRSGKPMAVGDIAQAVRACGYHSSSANFRGIVNQTLIKDKRFGQVSRGTYQLKK